MKTVAALCGSGQKVAARRAEVEILYMTDRATSVRCMELAMACFSAVLGILRRVAVRAVAVRIMRGRLRMPLSAGAVRAELSAERKSSIVIRTQNWVQNPKRERIAVL